VGSAAAYELGDVTNGINANKSLRLTEKFRLLGDCGNCIFKVICGRCPAVASEYISDSSIALIFQNACQLATDSFATILAEYVTIMETSGDVIDRIIPEGAGFDWTNSVEFLLTEEQLEEVEGWVEELDELL
jgi:hypothetical protein